MADKFTMPKGRMTVRKNGGRRVRCGNWLAPTIRPFKGLRPPTWPVLTRWIELKPDTPPTRPIQGSRPTAYATIC